MMTLMGAQAEHWDEVYDSRSSTDLSWFEPEPATSLRLLERWTTPPCSLVDVGAGVSTLVDRLLDDGFADLTLVDVSARALDTVRERLGARASHVAFVCTDVLSWHPDRRYDAWHDRAVLHFLTDPEDRDRYVACVEAAVADGGIVVLSTFAAKGPEQCSGLPVSQYDATDLAALFGAYELLHSEQLEHVTPQGRIQPFTTVVLRRTSTEEPRS